MGNRESPGKSGVQPVREKRSHESIERELDEVVARLRDSDIDIRDYMPDMDTILREARPERRAEKLRAALELERDITLRQSLSDIASLRAEPDPVRLEHKLHAVIAKARTSDVELGEYFPDLETIRREADPARRAKKLRDALDNPGIDEALVGARNSLARIDRATPNRGSQPSPWAQQAPEVGAIDKAALPSAMMPFSPVADKTPDAEHAATLDKAPTPVAARPSRRWTIAQSVIAVIAVVAPLTMMYFLLVWRKDPGPAVPAPAATSATTATPPVPSVSAPTAAPSLEPSSAPSSGPTLAPSDSATAPQVPTAEPRSGKPPHGGTHVAPPSPSGDPVVPSLPKTAEPVIPPPATASAPLPPTTASAPFLLRKKEP